MSTPHIATVQSIYEAFGRGDVPTLLAHLASDIEWEYGAAPNDVPWLQRRRGHAGFVGFLESLAGNLQLTRFQPTELLAGQDKVVVLLTIEGVVPRTGRTIAEVDEVHIWHFGPDGKVSRFRHVVDSLQHHQAWLGAQPWSKSPFFP